MTLIDDLLELNLVERQLRGLKSRVDSAQIYCRAQKRQMNDLEQRHEELETRRKQRQVTINGHETDTAAIDERLTKLREDLNSAANTKQYSTVLEEINTLKSTKSGTDDLILNELSDIEAADAFYHLVTIGWKLFFSIVPPAHYAGGWACFCCALGVIGIVTAVVGEFASI